MITEFNIKKIDNGYLLEYAQFEKDIDIDVDIIKKHTIHFTDKDAALSFVDSIME